MRLHARTHVGRVRDHNEDDFLCDPSLGLFVVADGMGGHAAGEVAASLAARAVQDAVSRGWGAVEAFARGAASPDDVRELLGAAVTRANAVVHAAGEADLARRGMGTTLTALLLVGRDGFVAHVGDSRMYLVRGSEARQVTEDHSLVNELRRRGRLRPEVLEQLQARNAVTRAVGVFPTVDVDTAHVLLAPGDRAVLCSDGLHRYLEGDAELGAILAELSEEAATQRLVDVANGRGGADNVTAVVLTVPGEDAAGGVARDLTRSYEALAHMPFFRGLEPRELLLLQALARVRAAADGEVIVADGAAGEAMYVILSGACVVRKNGVDLARLGPGEHFGEMSLVDRAPRSASVVADGGARLLEIPREDLLRLLEERQGTAYKLLFNITNVLAQRLRQTTEDLGEAREPARDDDHDTWRPPPQEGADATDPAIPAPPALPDLGD